MDITKLKMLFEILLKLKRGKKFSLFIEEFRERSLLMRTFVVSGIIFPILCLMLWACSVDKDFVKKIQAMNEDVLEAWADDVLRLPGYQKADQVEQFQLFQDMLGPALDERKLILNFNKLPSDKTEEEYVKALKERAEIRLREGKKYLEALMEEVNANAGK